MESEVAKRDVDRDSENNDATPKAPKADKRPAKASAVLLTVLVVYALLNGMKIGEPYVFKYQTDVLNLTSTEITTKVYHVQVYTCALVTIPAFILADVLLTKPFMYLDIVGHIGYRFTLVFCSGLFSQQVGQFFYALTTLNFSFYSYVCYVTDKEQYRKVTTWIQASVLAGRLSGSLISQAVVLTAIGTYWALHLTSFCVGVVLIAMCFWFPRLSWKQLALNLRQKDNSSPRPLPASYREFASRRFRKLKRDFLTNYSLPAVCKWSFWWALATTMHTLMGLFYQALFGELQTHDHRPLNAFADAIYTSLGFLAILGFNRLPIDWDRWGEAVLVVVSLVDAGVLFLFARTQFINVMYVCYIAYRILYQVMFTVAQWNIAKATVGDCFSLIFGVNLFVVFVLQTVMVEIVISDNGFGLSVRQAFEIFSYTHIVISCVFFSSIIYTLFSGKCGRGKVKASESFSSTCSSSAGNDVSPQ